MPRQIDDLRITQVRPLIPPAILIEELPISEPASKNNPTRHFNSYGMGWFLFDYQGRKVLNHSGGLDGMLSYTVLIPEENIGFVVLTNSESPAFGIMMSKMLDVFTNAPKRDWNAEALERLEKVDTLVVDKTGTLTEGKPKVVAVAPAEGFEGRGGRGP